VENIMPILVDFNQIAISNLMISLKMGHINEVNESMLRHMILNSLRGHRSKFHEEYGELVICCDGRNTWRKEFFPYYKQKRKTNREASGLDWNEIFGILNTIIEELDEHFPYKVIRIESAEADDIIGVLARNWIDEKVLILSGDKDFMQLQTNENIKQYSPVLKKFLRTDNPKEFLFEHIVRGDVSDGIPNCLSKDSTFVLGERQTPIRKKRLEEWMKAGKVDYKNGDVGFDRNQRLIDLSFIPYGLQEDIIDCYDEAKPHNNDEELSARRGLFSYFVNKRLKKLMENIQEF
jgi:hypothetical protein